LVEQSAFAALKVASRAYVLEVGKVAMSDSAENLLKNPEVQNSYLGGGQNRK
jgi:branched-chain amino acid transport system ATP-binding protein